MEGKRLKSLALLHTDAHRLKDIYMYLPFNVRNPQHKKEAVHLPSPLSSKEWRYVQLEGSEQERSLDFLAIFESVQK